MTTWTLNSNNLTKFLTQAGFEPLLERESGLTYINLPAEGHDLPLFFMIRSNGEVLQMICYFPYQLTPQHTNGVSRLLHLLNRDIDVPGFGMDEDQGLIFYRLVLPCLKGEMHSPLLRVYVDTIRLICDSFSHAIGLITSGNMDLDTIKETIRKENQGQ